MFPPDEWPPCDARGTVTSADSSGTIAETMSAQAPLAAASPPRRLLATRYVTALREGGSVPAVVEADDGQLWVAKFRGSAQGGRVLAAELIIGELARAAGLPVPELALIDVDAAIGRSEPHQEIRELLMGSAGLNLAMGYLGGALGYDAAARTPVAGPLASAVVALDVLAANVDRTPRNPNLLWWRGELWLIDHGASLYWHHGWDVGDAAGAEALRTSATRQLPRVGEHVLLPFADALPAAAEALARALDDETLARAVAAVPGEWLDGPLTPREAREPAAGRRGDGADRLRRAYLTWLRARRAVLPALLEEADRVRASRV
jgi:hypothetical protein